MKKLVIIVCLLVGLIGFTGGAVVAAPDLYEHYNTGDDAASSGPTGGHMYAQTFTAESNHDVTSVKLKLYRYGTPGNLNVSIRATSSGIPTGDDLTSGILDMNGIVDSSPGAWYEIPLSPTYSLANGVVYAIVISAPDAPGGSYPHICFDQTSPEYADGNIAISANAGASWNVYTDKDFVFEIHGPSSTSQEVSIDIMPGSDTNPINAKSKGVIPVAILGAEDFDVMTVDAASLSLVNPEPDDAHTPVVPIRWSWEDVNGDGFLDLIAHFDAQEVAGHITVTRSPDRSVLPVQMSGNLMEEYGGLSIIGYDTITVINRLVDGL